MLDSYVSSKDAKNAILLAKKYRVDSWLKAAYTRMVQRLPKIEELLQTPSLDWETIARILYAKQLFVYPTAHYYCTCGDNTWTPVNDSFCGCRESMTQINSAIEQSFRMELDDIKGTPNADPPSPSKYIVFHHKKILLLTRRHGNVSLKVRQ